MTPPVVSNTTTVTVPCVADVCPARAASPVPRPRTQTAANALNTTSFDMRNISTPSFGNAYQELELVRNDSLNSSNNRKVGADHNVPRQVVISSERIRRRVGTAPANWRKQKSQQTFSHLDPPSSDTFHLALVGLYLADIAIVSG